MNEKIEAFLEKPSKWQKEFIKLHNIILECQLNEDFKWMHPCYTYQNSNIVLIHGFKEYCALSFFKGALLFDEEKILIQPTENMQSGRQIRFKSLAEIEAMQKTIKAYIIEAIEVEKAGLKVEKRSNTEQQFPAELLKILEENLVLKKAFYALTPGRQRAYNLFFSGTKNSNTIISRIEKNIPRILNGKGLTDCICGLSKRGNNCDGSHKYAAQPKN